MLALSTSAPLISAAEAVRVARELYGLQAEVSALPGERDCNFHLRTPEAREFVLKFLDPDAPPGAIDCQVAVLRHLAEQDPSLPIQRVFPTLAGAPIGGYERALERYSTCLLGYLPGQLLARVRPEAALLEVIGRTLARLDHALQGFYHPALAPRLAWDVRRLPELAEYLAFIPSVPIRGRVEGVIGDIERRMTELRGLRSQAIHGDCHPSNLLIDPAARLITGILDFGDMLHAPRILEPAVAMSELLTEGLVPLGAVGTLLAGYAHESPLDAAEVDLLYDLVRARHACTLLLHAYRSRHDPGGATVLEAATVHAVRSLEELERVGRAALTHTWQLAAGGPGEHDAGRVSLERRRRLMGAGAPLFYEQPLHITRGSGVHLYDAAGCEYLDVYNNVPHVGHAHPHVVAAIQRQVATLVTHTRYLHASILEYAERLTATLPKALDTCLFVNSGSEANDVAWRLARFATGHEGGIVFEHAYHGITAAVAPLSPSGGHPLDAHVVTLGLPPAALRAQDAFGEAARAATAADADRALATLQARGMRPAACYIDSGLTSSGILDPPPAWAAIWAERVRRAGALIVGDEVQYGLGRSGSHFWGFERRGLEPDIVTLGKPVGNGFPMGVVIAPRALIEAFQAKYGFFSTFGGNPVAAVAGLAVLEVLEREQLMANARLTGDYLRGRLATLTERHAPLAAARGVGLMLGLEVRPIGSLTAPQAAQFMVNHMARHSRVLIGTEGAQGEVLKLRPPLPFRIEHADRLTAAIESAVIALAERA